MILPENIRDEADAMHVAERVVQALASPFVLPGVTVRISASVGVAFAGPDARDPALPIDEADSAFTKPKAPGNRASRSATRPAARAHRTEPFMTCIPRGTLTGTNTVG